MVLLDFYNQIKERLRVVNSSENGKAIKTVLYNDTVFLSDQLNDFPSFLFKYKDIEWQTSSEREYKASVLFSIYIVLPPNATQDYTTGLQLAQKVNEALLSKPSTLIIKEEKEETVLKEERKETFEEVPVEEAELRQLIGEDLITDSIQKLQEKQCTVEGEYWKKNDFFIWEIQYKTTLVEKSYKKRYTLLTNDAFKIQDLNNPINKEKIRLLLAEIGINLEDYLGLDEKDKVKLLEQSIQHIIQTGKEFTL